MNVSGTKGIGDPPVDGTPARAYRVGMKKGSTDSRRVALVTGGATRVGRAIVERLLKEEFAVALTYHANEQSADEIVTAAGADRALAIRVDLTQPAESVEQIQLGVAGFSDRLDVLVNNASSYQPADLESATLELSRRLMAIHYESPLLLAQAFAKRLRASRGHIVNMVDLLAEKPWPKFVPYCASKAALWNLTLSLSRALAPEVTVNGIAPGVVEWPKDYPDAERQKYLARVPLGRSGTPEDVAGLVHYLCGQGDYITGQIIRLDGGRSISS